MTYIISKAKLSNVNFDGMAKGPIMSIFMSNSCTATVFPDDHVMTSEL